MAKHSYYLRAHHLKISRDVDQVELQALKLGTSRAVAGVRDDSIADTLEEHYSPTSNPQEEAWQTHETSLDSAASGIIEVIEARTKVLGELYPFRLSGDVLKYHESESLLYEFLLCTSLSPSLTSGKYVEFPRKFEQIAMRLTANFLGTNTKFCHTGWPNEHKGFKPATQVAITQSRELVWQPHNDLPNEGPPSGDAGVDYILWKDFGCGRPVSQPFYLGQCACGNDWDTKLNDISQKFHRWFERLKVDPGKIFAIPFALPESKLRDVAPDAGIVMDRLRLVKALSYGEHYEILAWRASLQETISLLQAA